MKHEQKLSPWILAGLALLGAFWGGFLGASLMADRDRADYCNEPREVLPTSNREVLEAIERLESHLQSFVLQRDAQRSLNQAEKGNEFLATAPNESISPPKDWQGELKTLPWPNVLPKMVARELVLRGLSPYDDPGVATLAREACFALDLLLKQSSEEMTRLNDEYSVGLVVGQEFSRIQGEIVQKEKAGFRLIVLELSNGLDEYIE